MKKAALLMILRIARVAGMFRFSRWITRNKLRILCYHGASLRDEHKFRGGLFIDPIRFERRMDFLASQKYPVLELSDALARLDAGQLPECSTVITIDDGWVGTAIRMAPILTARKFPATLYCATYYLEKQTQVFNVAVAYLLWQVGADRLNLNSIDERLHGVFDIEKEDQRDAALAVLCDFAEALPEAADRQSLFRRICEGLEIDSSSFEDSRLISFMNLDEARALQRNGIDLQLHTHRHRLDKVDFSQVEKELSDNRAVLKEVTVSPRVHFCYPSGEYEPLQLAWLRKCGIETATTTQGGFNDRATNKLELRRFLDSERITDIEFEAEMSGFFEIVRRAGYPI